MRSSCLIRDSSALSKGEVTGTDVRVQVVPAIALFVEGTKKSTVGLAKGARFKAPGVNGSIHV